MSSVKTVRIPEVELTIDQLVAAIRQLEPEARSAIVEALTETDEKRWSIADWDTRWDALAQKISQAWKSDKSAVEVLAEMRR
jgi:hypothetical protein